MHEQVSKTGITVCGGWSMPAGERMPQPCLLEDALQEQAISVRHRTERRPRARSPAIRSSTERPSECVDDGIHVDRFRNRGRERHRTGRAAGSADGRPGDRRSSAVVWHMPRRTETKPRRYPVVSDWSQCPTSAKPPRHAPPNHQGRHAVGRILRAALQSRQCPENCRCAKCPDAEFLPESCRPCRCWPVTLRSP